MDNRFKAGEKAILDKGWAEFEKQVEVIGTTEKGNWCDVVVSTTGKEISVMTARLSKING